MGPAGSGKTTIGELLAAQLGWQFSDGDSFHSAANVEKMSRGIPLTDADRLPWLQSIRDAMLKWRDQNKHAVLACSALKRRYREILLIGPEVKFVYLKGSFELLRQRLHSRKGNYMGEQLLASQFADLEEPSAAEGLSVDVASPPEQIVAEIRKQLGLT